MGWKNDINNVVDDANHTIGPHYDPLTILSKNFSGVTIKLLKELDTKGNDAYVVGQGQMVILEIVRQELPHLTQYLGVHSFPQDQSLKLLTEIVFGIGFSYGWLTKKEGK